MPSLITNMTQGQSILFSSITADLFALLCVCVCVHSDKHSKLYKYMMMICSGVTESTAKEPSTLNTIYSTLRKYSDPYISSHLVMLQP